MSSGTMHAQEKEIGRFDQEQEFGNQKSFDCSLGIHKLFFFFYIKYMNKRYPIWIGFLVILVCESWEICLWWADSLVYCWWVFFTVFFSCARKMHRAAGCKSKLEIFCSKAQCELTLNNWMTDTISKVYPAKHWRRVSQELEIDNDIEAYSSIRLALRSVTWAVLCIYIVALCLHPTPTNTHILKIRIFFLYKWPLNWSITPSILPYST